MTMKFSACSNDHSSADRGNRWLGVGRAHERKVMLGLGDAAGGLHQNGMRYQPKILTMTA